MKKKSRKRRNFHGNKKLLIFSRRLTAPPLFVDHETRLKAPFYEVSYGEP